MENYIVINGKKSELTAEQLEKLGIEVPKKRNNPFDRVARGMTYFIPIFDGTTEYLAELNDRVDKDYYDNTNYFNDKEFARQVALTQLLYRKLLKYSYDNDAKDSEWNVKNEHYTIYYDTYSSQFFAYHNNTCKTLGVWFSKKSVANNAIKDVIEPFMTEHPNFKW